MKFTRALPRSGDLYRLGLVLILSAWILSACQVSPKVPLPPPPRTPTVSISTPGAWYTLFFSDPSNPKASTLRGGPDQALAEAINQARMEVEVAAYDLDLWSIRDALIAAHNRGVRVQMVTDSDNLAEPEIQDLVQAGVAVLGDRREGLMHNKFVVIDGQDLWSGSMNLTLNSAYRNNDNLIHIHSPELSRNYQVEFNEMFLDDHFGPGSPANTPDPILDISGSKVEVYFSPEDGVEAHIIDLIQSAEHSIQFMAYSFTSDKIAAAMLARAAKGVEVSGVFEAEQVKSNSGTEYDNLHSAGLDVRQDGNPRNMHHKVIVIDGKIVLTGSYNFTQNANKLNDENLLVIHNPEIARLYQKEFNKIYAQALP